MKFFKILLNVFLSFSLALAPYYAYSGDEVSTIQGQGPNASNFEEFVQRLAENNSGGQIPPEVQEASRILTEMGEAVEQGSFTEYLNNHPDLVDHFDILSLRNQAADIIDARDDSIDAKINFNTYTHQAYPTIIKNIEVEFPESNPVLTLKGVTVEGDENRDKKIGVVHYFEDIEKKDVIDWAYDRDILAVLHREKGLVLYHIFFAKSILGESPVPSIRIPIHSKLLEKDLKLEFMDRSVEPPQRPPSSSKRVAVNTTGEPFYSAGDLLISYTDARGSKRIEKIFSRSGELYKALYSKYVILDFLLQTVILQIRDATEAQDVSLNAYSLQKQSKSTFLSSMLSSILNRESLRFLKGRSSHIFNAKIFLLSHLDKDVFSHSSWVQDYKTLQTNIKKMVSINEKNMSGKTISSSDIAKILDHPEDENKDIDESKVIDESNDKNWKVYLKNKYPQAYKTLSKMQNLKTNVVNAMKSSKADIAVFSVAAFLALMHAGSISHGQDVNYVLYTAYNFVFFGVALLVLVHGMARYSIGFLEKIERVLPHGDFKVKVNQTIEKWKDQNTKARLVGMGFKISATLLYPYWLRVSEWSGKPHFFPALASGLKVGQKITLEPKEGSSAQLETPQRLGLSGWQWRSSTKQYKDHEKLMDIVISRNEKIQSLSRILTHYALSGESFTSSLLLSGLAPLVATNSLEKMYADQDMMKNFVWVSRKLSESIEESNKVHKNESVLELDPEVLKEYYQKALELAEESKGRSSLQRNMYSFWNVFTEKLRTGLLWNSEQSKILSKYTPNPEVANLFSTQLIMDHITLVTIPLTPLTPRGDYFGGNAHQLGVSSSPSYLFSSPPHFHEGVVNIGTHIVISARTQLQSLGVRESLLKAFEEAGQLYEPIENYRSHDNQQGLRDYLWDFAKYPFDSWGLKYEKGTDQEDRLDVGDRLWNYQKLYYRFMQVTFTISLLSRLLLTDSSVTDAFVGTLYFFGGMFIYYGWPTIWMTIQNLAYSKKRLETKNKINKIYTVLYKIQNNLYSSESDLIQEYESALEGFKTLYSSSRKVSKSMPLDALNQSLQSFVKDVNLSEEQKADIKKYIETSNSEDKVQNIQEMISLLKNPHLPTVNNKTGESIIALLTLGIFSNLAFVFLSVDSFSDPSLTSAFFLFTATLAGSFLASKLTADNLKNRMSKIRANACRLSFTRFRKQNNK